MGGSLVISPVRLGSNAQRARIIVHVVILVTGFPLVAIVISRSDCVRYGAYLVSLFGTTYSLSYRSSQSVESLPLLIH